MQKLKLHFKVLKVLLKEVKSVPLILSIFVSKYVFKHKGFRVKEFISMKLLSRLWFFKFQRIEISEARWPYLQKPTKVELTNLLFRGFLFNSDKSCTLFKHFFKQIKVKLTFSKFLVQFGQILRIVRTLFLWFLWPSSAAVEIRTCHSFLGTKK